MQDNDHPILTRWRLMLGGGKADGTEQTLSGTAKDMDLALDALYEYERRQEFDYEEKDNKKVGRGRSSPQIARWLGDIRRYFPQSVVEVMQHDAMHHPQLRRQMLLEPEVLAQATPDVHLVATLLELGKLMPEQTRDTARQVVRQVVDELLKRIQQKTVAAIRGAIHRSTRQSRPRYHEINWTATILKNLRHYQPQYRTIIPEQRIGYGHKNRRSMKDIVLCLDQSGSMGTSVVYTGIFGAVLASLPEVRTRLVAYDTAVADLTEDLQDPVDLLFGVQLGGGNDTNKALTYCQSIITRPEDTILVHISDLYEGAGEPERLMRQRWTELVDAGVQVIVLLALNDEGRTSYERDNAHFLATIGVPAFACTPDQFPDLMAAAIARQDLHQWAHEHGVSSSS
jgi:Mg-chelatase subunit ChlD